MILPGPVADAEVVEHGAVPLQAVPEVDGRPARRRGPAHFRQRQGAGERHVLHLRRGGDVLGPDVALDAQHVVGAGAADGAGNGIEVVDLLQRQEAANGRRFGRGVARLIVVRICDIHPSPHGVSHNPPYAAQARLGTARSEAAKAISSTNRL